MLNGKFNKCPVNNRFYRQLLIITGNSVYCQETYRIYFVLEILYN